MKLKFTFLLGLLFYIQCNQLMAQSPIPELTEDVEKDTVAAYAFNTAPTIDGDLTDWIEAGAEWRYLGDSIQFVRGYDVWSGEEDRSVIYSFMWDADYLYYASVNYDDVLTPAPTIDAGWKGDCTFFWIDSDGDNVSDNVSQVMYFESEGNLLSMNNEVVDATARTPYPDGVLAYVLVSELGDGGRITEFALPWKYLPNASPEIESLLGINIGVEEGNTAPDNGIFIASDATQPLEENGPIVALMAANNTLDPGPDPDPEPEPEPETTLSSKESVTNQLGIYPNPVTDYITVQNADKVLGTISTISGTTVQSFNLENNRINVSDLPRGVFILKIESNGLSYVKRFIK